MFFQGTGLLSVKTTASYTLSSWSWEFKYLSR